jgi:hypothetical protein
MSSRLGREMRAHFDSADKSLASASGMPDVLIADAKTEIKSKTAIFIRRKGIIGLLLIKIRAVIQVRKERPVDYPNAQRYSQGESN